MRRRAMGEPSGAGNLDDEGDAAHRNDGVQLQQALQQLVLRVVE